MITLDFGVNYRGFNTDMTRTIALGKVSTELQKMYDVVRVAQQRAILHHALGSGAHGRKVAARFRFRGRVGEEQAGTQP